MQQDFASERYSIFFWRKDKMNKFVGILGVAIALALGFSVKGEASVGQLATQAVVATDLAAVAESAPQLFEAIASANVGSASLAQAIGFKVPAGTIWSAAFAKKFVDALKQNAQANPTARATLNFLNGKVLRMAASGQTAPLSNADFIAKIQAQISSVAAAAQTNGSATASAESGFVGPYSPTTYAQSVMDAIEKAHNAGQIDMALYNELREAAAVNLEEIKENGLGIWDNQAANCVTENAAAGEAPVLSNWAKITVVSRGLQSKVVEKSKAAATALVTKLAELTVVPVKQAWANYKLLNTQCHWVAAPAAGF